MGPASTDYRVAPPSGTDPDNELLVPRFVDTLRTIAATSSFVATLIGVVVLIGWSLDVEALKRFIPGLTAMNPATAVGFICSGCALGLIATQPDLALARRLAIALAAVTALLGAARVLAIAGLYDAGVDRLLDNSELLTADFGRANQMAPNTAVNFLLLGAALMIIDRPLRRFRWPAQLLALSAAMTALLALMGYAYGLRSFYGIGSQIAMDAADGADVHDRVDRRAVRPAGPRHHGRGRQRQQRRHDDPAAAAGRDHHPGDPRRDAPGRAPGAHRRHRLRALVADRLDHDDLRHAGGVERAAPVPHGSELAPPPTASSRTRRSTTP